MEDWELDLHNPNTTLDKLVLQQSVDVENLSPHDCNPPQSASDDDLGQSLEHLDDAWMAYHLPLPDVLPPPPLPPGFKQFFCSLAE